MCLSAAAVMAISTGVSVIGQLQQGQVTKQANDAKAQELSVAAEQSKVSAAEEAKRIRKAGEKTAGAARAALAGAGIAVDQGSAVNINEDIYRNSESDAMNTLLTGSNQATSYNRQAGMARSAGNDAVTSSILGSLTTAADGGAKYAGWKGKR